MVDTTRSPANHTGYGGVVFLSHPAAIGVGWRTRDEVAPPADLPDADSHADLDLAAQPAEAARRSSGRGFSPQVFRSVARLARPGAMPKRPNWTRRQWALFVAAVLLIPVVGSLFMLTPLLFASRAPLTVVSRLEAPITTVRAPDGGRITGLAVHEGETVTPDTLLLTIHRAAAADPAAAALRARLASVRARIGQLEASPGRSTASDAGRAQAADLARRRDAARAEAAQLNDALKALPPQPEQLDIPVRAGVGGTLWSVMVSDGAETAPGAPLMRLVDCSHAFLAVPDETALTPGQRVDILLDGGSAGAGLIRWAAGPNEPAGRLVVVPEAASPGTQCQVGAGARLTPYHSL